MEGKKDPEISRKLVAGNGYGLCGRPRMTAALLTTVWAAAKPIVRRRAGKKQSMAQVIHTVDVVYGSYSGTTTVRCDENDDMSVIEAKVRRQEKLDFLSMATYRVKIIDTKRLDYAEEGY